MMDNIDEDESNIRAGASPGEKGPRFMAASSVSLSLSVVMPKGDDHMQDDNPDTPKDEEPTKTLGDRQIEILIEGGTPKQLTPLSISTPV